jgi:predicted nuclease of predicted toxin-antitoxin system
MLRLLIDENLNQRILRGLKLAVPELDCVVAGRAGLKGASDPELLEWCAERALVLVTHDANTIPRHAYDRVRAGQPMPGVVIVPSDLEIGSAISDLRLVVECCSPAELSAAILYLPL